MGAARARKRRPQGGTRDPASGSTNPPNLDEVAFPGGIAQTGPTAVDLTKVSLPLRARCVVGASIVAGSAVLVPVVRAIVSGGLSERSAAAALFIGALVLWSWVSPLMIFRNGESESVHLDEGFFVLMMAVLPKPMTVITFAAVVIIAQIARRHPPVKAAFNLGQIVVSAGLGVATTSVLGGFSGRVTAVSVLAIVAGAATFYVVNSLWLAAIMIATGSNWRAALVDGLELRFLLVGASVAVGIATGIGAADHIWVTPIAVVPLLILRGVLGGHFRARDDRVRMRGLFEAALDANRSFGHGTVASSITTAAQSLLRCSVAELREGPPADGELGAAVALDGHDLWLVVSGRSRTEPFDSADESLLQALVAVGAGALTNAELYREGRIQRERLAAITSSLGEGVCAIGTDLRVTFLNPAAAAMLGLPEVQMSSGGPGSAPPAPPFLAGPALRAMSGQETVRDFDTTFERADGSTLPVALTASSILDGDAATGAVLVFRDVTERKQLEEQLARHAFQDPLTGLANRRVFLDHLGQAVRRSARSGEIHAVLFADVDRFKLINDSLGHHTGDELLVAIARRLSGAIRAGDLLARLGGDEFTVLLQGISGPEEAMAVAERILEDFREPFQLIDGHDIVATLSVGIAITTPDKDADDVLRDADVAMYQAKARGRNGFYELYDTEAMGARSTQRLELETALRRAVERDELEVYFQPLIDIATRAVTGTEALVRWNHPTRGVVAPGEFITVAEETGLILPIGRFVLEKACAQAKRWQDRFGTPHHISVNLSARQFQQPDLLDQVRNTLETTGLDPGSLCLEITESLAMDDVGLTSTVLQNLHELGIHWAIDDFGTGYSSLSYLKRFPVDVVKIDRSFVDGLERSEVDTAIAGAIIGLAKTLNMTTVAEGVETIEQLEHLDALGCNIAQGYLFSRPGSASTIEALLATSARRPDLSIELVAAV